MEHRAGTRTQRASVFSFLGWAAVGLLLALGVAALLTIGAVFLLAAAALTGVLAWRRAYAGRAPLGLGAGAGLVVGYIGWLNRGGPGDVCHRTAHGGGTCMQELAPWPFYAAAALLVAGSIALFAVQPWPAGPSRSVRP